MENGHEFQLSAHHRFLHRDLPRPDRAFDRILLAGAGKGHEIVAAVLFRGTAKLLHSPPHASWGLPDAQKVLGRAPQPQSRELCDGR